jgi:hypothetical protein
MPAIRNASTLCLKSRMLVRNYLVSKAPYGAEDPVFPIVFANFVDDVFSEGAMGIAGTFDNCCS